MFKLNLNLIQYLHQKMIVHQIYCFFVQPLGRGLGASHRNGPPATPLTLRACGRSSSLTSNETYSSFTRVLNVLTLGQIFCW